MPDGGFAGGSGTVLLIEVLFWSVMIVGIVALGIYLTLMLFPRKEADESERAVGGTLGPLDEELPGAARARDEAAAGTAADERDKRRRKAA